MTGESRVLRAVERSRLAAAISGWSTTDYVTVRALVALSDDTPDRIGRFTAMGRQFVADVRRRVRDAGAQAVLAEPASASERVLETATDQIVQPGPRELTMSAVADLAGVPRRTLYNMYAASGELVEACRRRGPTLWRAGRTTRPDRRGRCAAAPARGRRRAGRVGRVGAVPPRSGTLGAAVVRTGAARRRPARPPRRDRALRERARDRSTVARAGRVRRVRDDARRRSGGVVRPARGRARSEHRSR